MERIDAIKRIIPGCAISQDIISSFCSETEEEHKDTLSLMDMSSSTTDSCLNIRKDRTLKLRENLKTMFQKK